MRPRNAIWILVLGVAGVASCGWFDTRNPSGGEAEPPVPWDVPIEPETVLANMDSALIYLGRGIENYAKCYGDTFHFYPTTNDADVLAQQGKPGAFENYDREVDREVMDLIVISAKSVDLTWTPDQVIADTEEYKIWEERYRLVIERLSGEVETYEGVAHLELRVDPNQADQWFITSWQDFFAPGQPDTVHTWGWLRGQARAL